MQIKYFSLKFENLEEHKNFEVSWLFQVASVDRQNGILTINAPTLEELEYWVKRIKECAAQE